VLEGSLGESLGDGDAGGCHFPFFGGLVSFSLPLSSKVENPVRYGRGAIGVATFLKALHLDRVLGFNVSFGGCVYWRLVDEWRQILQREVGDAASGTWLDNNDIGRTPLYRRLGLLGVCIHWGRGVGS
jgi:hypothetical protein